MSTWLGLSLWWVLATPNTTFVRVELTRRAIEIRFPGPVAVVVPDEEPTPVDGEVTVVPDGELLRIGAARSPAGTAFVATEDQPLAVELRTSPDQEPATATYRGRIVVYPLPDGHLVIVDELTVDDYLRGVLPLEMGAAAPPAALRAQAIVARSYALARRGDGTRPMADLAVANTQVYRGAQAETPATDEAVAATTGQVLVADGKVVEACYHACCGGTTAGAEEAWSTPAPGLISVVDTEDSSGRTTEPFALPPGDNDWCQANPNHRWTRSYALADLARLLADGLRRVAPKAKVGAASRLEVAERGPSGRVTALLVGGVDGQLVVRGDSIRQLFGGGAEMLPSTLFTLDLAPGGLTIHGAGNGHGVGLCQAGAMAMAAAGLDEGAILRHYFPAAEVARE